MGNAYRQLGLYQESRPLLEQAVALEQRSPRPGRPARRAQPLSCWPACCAGSASSTRRASTTRPRSPSANARDNPDDIAVSLTGLANLEVDEGTSARQRSFYRRALAITRARSVGTRFAPLRAHLCRAWRSPSGASARPIRPARPSSGWWRSSAARLPPDDLDLAWSLATLGTFYAEAISTGRARALGEEALAVQERALGPDHTDVAETLDLLANLHHRDGDFAQALALHQREVAIWEKAVGTENATYAMALDHLARDLAGLDRLDEAIAASEKARVIFARTLAPDHPAISQNQVILAIHVSRRRRARPARGRCSKRPSPHRLANLGTEHREVAEVQIELGRISQVQERWAEARTHYEWALRIARKEEDADRIVPQIQAELDDVERHLERP